MVKGFQAQQQGSSYIIFLMRRATEPGEFSISSSYYTSFSLLAVSPANLHDTMQPHNTPFAAYLL